MADRETWAKRVAEWRASGLTSERFCAGRGYTAGALRSAAHTVEAQQQGAAQRLAVARVVVRPSHRVESGDATPGTGVVIELGGARVAVERGFDRDTLASVLDVLATRAGAA